MDSGYTEATFRLRKLEAKTKVTFLAASEFLPNEKESVDLEAQLNSYAKTKYTETEY